MAGLCCDQLHDLNSHHPKVNRRPSLYASVRLARFVYRVKERLKCHTQQRNKCKKKVELPQTSLYAQARRDFDHSIRFVPIDLDPDSKDWRAGKRPRQEVSLLLRQLDGQSSDAERTISAVATCDQLFLAYDARDVIRDKNIKELRHIYDLTTSLLARLPSFLGSIASQGWPRKSSELVSGVLSQDKTTANFDHIVRCLRQASLEALIFHGLESLEKDVQQWHQHWLQRRQLDHGWFLEWPNGRRPLSTTWPWNVRPSLVVLWGVCWMFYDNSTRSAMEMRQQLQNNQEVATSLWVRQTPQSATASQRKPQRTPECA
ncbi:MAG: hypothetical protein Q9201_007300 [Fulgogasparrea decipioides]